ncbi:DUF4091 domain-containing protein [Corallococcus exercitus]|uniref:DUF4091 domain-containing protein n=1 Tax=Corallococcus exercitus TaxID=2316736 RepID=A0A3A8I9D5_9BACT|nr:DUF4091 domain-containing protein [Corallococcus exercitus]NOK31901.1 DUF4091 domain-containing protein [Corallococcus exercitus]RKG74961.1 DUF4091 domain-containing protein [Corallococcus exercitus]
MGVGWAWAVAAVLSAAPGGVQVVSPLVKVRPDATPKGAKEAHLSAARGECEGTQLVLPQGVTRVTMQPLALKGPGAPLTTDAWREAYLDVKTPSNGEGKTGPWPDALVPLSAPANPKHPTVVYVEVCVPAKQAPGTYTGSLSAAVDGKDLPAVPFTVEVQPFDLPATSSLPNSFGISLYSIAKAHGLQADSPEAKALLREYGKALLEHRVSAHGMGMDPPPVKFQDGRAVLDWTAYDAEMGPFLDGTVLPSGARFTTADVRDNRKASTDAEKTAYYRAFQKHFEDKGWKAQLFFYAKDEPKAEDVPLVKAQAKRVRDAGGTIPVLVTTALDPAFNGSVDILTPIINCFYPREGPQTCRNVANAATARTRLPPRAKVWWYQSCMAHGCTGGPPPDKALDKAFSDWASYMVDHPAPLNRAMGPLAFESGVDGELYFDTVFAYNTKKDVWTDLFEFGGNGDGTLFYPGTPAKLGGTEHQPVVSLRLKHIRDGLEDYEYLRLLTSLGDGAFARTAAKRLAKSGYEISRDPAEWEAVRKEVTERIVKRQAAEEAKRSGRRTSGGTP